MNSARPNPDDTATIDPELSKLGRHATSHAMTDGITRRTTLAALAVGTTPLLQDSSRNPLKQPVAAPFIRTRSALDRLREIGSSVSDTGALGDGRADDTHAIQEMIDHYARLGGEWYFPPGVFKTTSPLVWNCTKPQRVRGRGKRGVYPGRYDPTLPSELAVILPVHAGRAAIEFTGSRNGDGTIELRDLALATLETGPLPVAGMAWDSASYFLRDFAFVNCSIHGFTAAFDLFRTGGSNTQMGLFKARRCTINRNRWIARTLNGTQWNGFSFRDNEAGQNGFLPGDGGIAIAAHNAMIAGNCLEGQRDPVMLTGSMRGVSVLDNYFEANVGIATIHLQTIRGQFDVGANSFIDCDPAQLDHLVLLTNCGPGRVLGPYWANCVNKMALPILGNSAAGDNGLNRRPSSDAYGLLRLDGFDNGNTYTREPQGLAVAKQRVAVAARELAPWNGHPMPVARHDTTDTTGIALDVAIAGAAGNWVVLSWLFRREPDVGTAANPYVSLSVNGNGAPGSRDYVANSFDEYWRPGEWCLLTAAIRLETTMTRLAIGLYPFGIKPMRGRGTRYLLPVVYVTDTPAAIIPYIDDYTARSVLIPPKAPGFLPGDIIMNGAVAGGGQAHYVKLPGSADRWAYA